MKQAARLFPKIKYGLGVNWCPRLNFNTLINIPLWLVKNEVDISISLSTRPWPNHTPLWPRPRANVSKAIWRTKCLLSCLWSGWGELVLRFEANMPFCACVCPYAYAYALVKTRLKERQIFCLKTMWNVELQMGMVQMFWRKCHVKYAFCACRPEQVYIFVFNNPHMPGVTCKVRRK